MEVHKRSLFGVAASIAIGLALGLQGFMMIAHSSGPVDDLTGNPAISSSPLILNTVDYALRAVNGTVLIPNASLVGPGFKIIGVQLFKPQLATTSAGVTWRNWGINFIISDRPFVNGTSKRTDFNGHWIVVMESVYPGILNSHDHALSYMAPQQLCHSYNNGTRTCTDLPNSKQLTQIRNTWVVVDPNIPSADFTIDNLNRGFYISGDMNYQQVLAVAGSVTP